MASCIFLLDWRFLTRIRASRFEMQMIAGRVDQVLGDAEKQALPYEPGAFIHLSEERSAAAGVPAREPFSWQKQGCGGPHRLLRPRRAPNIPDRFQLVAKAQIVWVGVLFTQQV